MAYTVGSISARGRASAEGGTAKAACAGAAKPGASAAESREGGGRQDGCDGREKPGRNAATVAAAAAVELRGPLLVNASRSAPMIRPRTSPGSRKRISALVG